MQGRLIPEEGRLKNINSCGLYQALIKKDRAKTCFKTALNNLVLKTGHGSREFQISVFTCGTQVL